jgi:hypothetical protein
MSNIFSITGKPFNTDTDPSEEHIGIPERLCEIALAIEHMKIPCEEMTIVTNYGEVFHLTSTKQDDAINVKSVVFNCNIGIAKMTSYVTTPDIINEIERQDE